METLRYVVLVNALLTVVSLAYYVLLRRETFFRTNRLVLWMGILATLLLPLLELPDWRPQPVRTVMHRTAQVIVPKILSRVGPSKPEVTITFPNQRTYPAFQNRSTSFRWSWPMLVLLVYAGVALVLFIRLGVQLNSLRRLIRQSVHESYGDFTLVRNEQVTSPFSFFDWVVLNPDRHASDELEQILRHERVHVRERHSLDMLGAELVCIVFWFNPAAYLFRFLLHQTLEFSADQTVLAEGVDVRAYQYNLVKVSLSAGQSAITNHFSKSQLTSRIRMLNQPVSSKTTWLKYPVFFMVVLTVVSAFARPQLKQLSSHLPKPMAEGIRSVLESSTVVATPSVKVEPPAEIAFIESASDQENKVKLIIERSKLLVDSTNRQVEKETVRISPSRYIMYAGDYLYFIITPKTTFDDLVIMKREFVKYGYSLHINELKYDYLSVFIDRFSFSINRPGGASMRYEELEDDYKPIPIIAGYIGINSDQSGASRLDGRYSKKFPLYQTVAEEKFPDSLRSTADDDMAITSKLVKSKEMEYMVLEGQRKYGHLGIGFRKFNKEEVRKQAIHDSYLRPDPNGFLSVDAKVNNTKIFINNEPATLEEVKKWKIDQLYTVSIILGYDEAIQKRSDITYVLFYIEKNK